MPKTMPTISFMFHKVDEWLKELIASAPYYFQDDPGSIGFCPSGHTLSPTIPSPFASLSLSAFFLSGSFCLPLCQCPQLSLPFISLADLLRLLYSYSLHFFFSPLCLVTPFLHLSFLPLYLFLPLPHCTGPSIFICPSPYNLPGHNINLKYILFVMSID